MGQLSSFGPLLVSLLPLVVVILILSRMGKKQREREAAKRTEALAVGNWVMTRAGFYGKIAEIDGDVVVLETPLGDETLWDAGSIVAQKEPPVAEGSTLLDGALDIDPLEDFVETELSTDVEEEDADA